MAANSTKLPGASQSPHGARLHAQAAKPPQNDDKPRSAEFAPSKPPSGLTERHENRSFNGAAKPRPTRNFRAADFISSLGGGGAPALKRCLFFFALLVLLAFLGLAGAVPVAEQREAFGHREQR